jgi:hypothetical protein
MFPAPTHREGGGKNNDTTPEAPQHHIRCFRFEIVHILTLLLGVDCDWGFGTARTQGRWPLPLNVIAFKHHIVWLESL